MMCLLLLITFQKQKLDDKKSTEGNKKEVNAADKSENEPENHQEDEKKSDNEKKITKPVNPLLKMFEKMREKNVSLMILYLTFKF